MYGGWGVSATNDSTMYVLDVIHWNWTRVATTGYPKDAIRPSTNPSDPTNTIDGESHDDGNNKISTGAIVGAIVGALVGLIAIAALVLFCIRKRRREEKVQEQGEDEVSENIQHQELKHPHHHHPYYHHQDDINQQPNQYQQQQPTTATNKRLSTGWLHGAMSTRNSFTRRSEIGDSDRVVTGILEELNQPHEDDGTAGATHGSRSPRESYRNSKVLLVPPINQQPGQVPNEIISQKPNEFSIPAMRFHHSANQQNIPIDHYQQEAPVSSSMEVLRSIKTNGSSMMNHPAGSQVSTTTKRGVPVTHATVEDDENWTFADSLSVSPAIQYILPNSQQLSTDTWDTTKDPRRIVDHHYPSSTLNMPIARTVTPPTTTNNSSSNNSSHHDLYHHNVLTENNPTPSHSRNGSTTLLKSREISSSISTTQSSSNSEQQFQSLQPLINALPRRYQVDKSKTPITGPTNHILFATHQDKVVAVKSFGRREAWERECRTLIRLKSPCVVEILEVLTIQSEPRAEEEVMMTTEEEVEGEIKYVTVMERLDETLSSFIRNSKRNNTTMRNGKIARDVLGCLSWCHGNGIAFCDLKPSNIMHNQDKAWKLIDFEGSRTIHEECVGVITPRYCPPEVARATTYGLEGANGVVATASVDLWSLGCVIYELETKKALFSSTMKDETILHFISHPSPSTPILNNGLRWNENKELEIPQLERIIPNAQTRQLIKTLLSREPSKRGSATQLLVSCD